MAAFDTLGERLRLIRLFLNASQSSVALLSGVKLAALNKAEQNTYTPSVSVLFKVAQALCVEQSWLLEGIPPIFSKRLAFLFLNRQASRTQGTRHHKTLAMPASVILIFSYLMEVQGVRAGSLITARGKHLFIFQCERGDNTPDYAVLNTDFSIQGTVMEVLNEAGIKIETHDLSGDEERDVTRSIERFYEEIPSIGLQRNLEKRLRSYIYQKEPTDPVLVGFHKFITHIGLAATVSPALGASDKVRVLLEFIRDLGISRKDAAKALEVLVSDKTWQYLREKDT